MELETYRARVANTRDGLAGQVDEGLKLIDELLAELSSTKAALAQTQLDLDGQHKLRRQLQEDIKQNEVWKEQLASRPFVVLLIDADADCYVFHDEFIGMAEKGGENAADALRLAMLKYLEDMPEVPRTVDIVVRAFASVSALGRVLEGKRRVSDVSRFREFTTGFSNRQAFFDFVDVGPGKERADTKIRASVEFFMHSYQCKHLVLACGHDSGYAPFLGQFAADSQFSGRMTLLQGLSPFPSEISNLGFKTTRFTSIFNEQTPPATWANRAGAASRGQDIIRTTAEGNTRINGVVAATMAPTLTHRESGRGWVRPEVQSERLGPVVKDQNGWRIDKPLSVNSETLEKMKKKNLCYFLFLRGECILRSCSRYHHHATLSPTEYDALWTLARHGKCYARARAGQDNRQDCSDAMCVYSHGRGGDE